MTASADIATRMDPATARTAIDRDGYVVWHDAVDADWVAAQRDAIGNYVMAHIAGMDAGSRATGASTSAPTFKLTDAPDAVVTFVTAERIGRMAATLLGVRAVRLLHFCGFFKPPGGTPTPWHRDSEFLPIDTDRIVTAWVPLVAIDAAMGMLAFAAGTHLDNGIDATRGTPTGDLRPGDISFHLGATLHCAAGNSSDRMREAIAICFYPDGARVGDDGGAPFRAALRRHYFADLQPGDLAVSAANPLVFSTAPFDAEAHS